MAARFSAKNKGRLQGPPFAFPSLKRTALEAGFQLIGTDVVRAEVGIGVILVTAQARTAAGAGEPVHTRIIFGIAGLLAALMDHVRRITRRTGLRRARARRQQKSACESGKSKGLLKVGHDRQTFPLRLRPRRLRPRRRPAPGRCPGLWPRRRDRRTRSPPSERRRHSGSRPSEPGNNRRSGRHSARR